jgi:hypothetical protein
MSSARLMFHPAQPQFHPRQLDKYFLTRNIK